MSARTVASRADGLRELEGEVAVLELDLPEDGVDFKPAEVAMAWWIGLRPSAGNGGSSPGPMAS